MNKQLSQCCSTPVKTVGSGDFHEKDRVCTMHYECNECGQPCNIVTSAKLRLPTDPIRITDKDSKWLEKKLKKNDKRTRLTKQEKELLEGSKEFDKTLMVDGAKCERGRRKFILGTQTLPNGMYAQKKLATPEDKYGLGDLYDKAFANGEKAGKSDTIKRIQEELDAVHAMATRYSELDEQAFHAALTTINHLNQFLKTLQDETSELHTL